MAISKNIEYFEAIEKQAELQKFWNPRIDKMEDSVTRTIVKSCLNARSELFYWSEPMIDIMCESATTIPGNWTFMQEALPSTNGFFWFAKPIAVTQSTQTIEGYEIEVEHQIHGISYIFDRSTILLLFYMKFGNKLGDVLEPLTTLPFPLQASVFTIPKTLREVGEHKKLPDDEYTNIMETKGKEWVSLSSEERESIFMKLVGKYSLDVGSAEIIDNSLSSLYNPQAKDVKLNLFAAMLAFLQQKILTPVRQSPPRPMRRRAERERRKLPLISIIKLRQLAYHSEGEHRNFEYTCQWLVRGHWRDQWYPSLKRNQPIWIAPYTKGPPDKPFKGAKRLFAVVR